MPREQKRLHEWREPVATRPAATILLLRDGDDGLEVLMTRRSVTASFAPGVFVFPGGALDADDASERARALSRVRPSQPDDVRPHSVAAIREAFEELGILLAYRPDGSIADASDLERLDRGRDADFLEQLEAGGYTMALDRVWWLCHWITDRDLPKRFDVRFFVAPVPHGQEPIADEGEQFEPVWTSPKRALERHEKGDFDMIFPTVRTLRRLAQMPDVDAVLSSCPSDRPLWVSSPRGGHLKGEIARFSEHEPAFGELELVTPDGRLAHSLDWQHEKAVPLLRNVLRLTAPNPGRMTGPGTNTYIIGEPGAYAVIDPGPDDPVHIGRIATIVGKASAEPVLNRRQTVRGIDWINAQRNHPLLDVIPRKHVLDQREVGRRRARLDRGVRADIGGPDGTGGAGEQQGDERNTDEASTELGSKHNNLLWVGLPPGGRQYTPRSNAWSDGTTPAAQCGRGR